ncbi:MAG: cytidylate kinase-like family protein [Balneolaceae bacterium]
MAKKVTQMIEEQIQFWTRKRSAEKSPALSGKKYPIITISREYSAQGSVLADKLGEMLGFKVWDKDLLVIISEKLGSSQEFIKSLDESRRGFLEDTIFGFMHHRETNLHYLLYLVKAVRALERFGNNIIVGRGANYICQKPTSLHIRVVCPIKDRVERYAPENNMPREKAMEFMKKKDADRANFVLHNFNREVANPSDYDLVLNSSSYTMDEMVELVINAYELKTGVKIPIIKQHSYS